MYGLLDSKPKDYLNLWTYPKPHSCIFSLPDDQEMPGAARIHAQARIAVSLNEKYIIYKKKN